MQHKDGHVYINDEFVPGVAAKGSEMAQDASKDQSGISTLRPLILGDEDRQKLSDAVASILNSTGIDSLGPHFNRLIDEVERIAEEHAERVALTPNDGEPARLKMPASVRHTLEYRIMELDGYIKKYPPETSPTQWDTEIREIERFISSCDHDGGYGRGKMMS